MLEEAVAGTDVTNIENLIEELRQLSNDVRIRSDNLHRDESPRPEDAAKEPEPPDAARRILKRLGKVHSNLNYARESLTAFGG